MKMRLLLSFLCRLIANDHSPTVIWAFHFGCRELAPSSWANGYVSLGELLELLMNASLLQTLVLESSPVVNKQFVLSSIRFLISNDRLVVSRK